MDRRSSDRRTPPPQGPESGGRTSGDQVDVEQIMRDIRARISQRHGIELSPQQIQDLAARRLEAILDPRTVSPTLMDQLRKGASAAPDPLPANPDGDYSFSENAIYETDSGLVRFLRRLLNPLLKLFFNPTPVVTALQTQARINRDAAARVADAERRQAEWNALHYQILQRLVTEVSRVSLETQALNARVESLGGRVDYNDRRVRSFETAAPLPGRNQRQEVPPVTSGPGENAPAAAETAPTQAAPPGQSVEGARRRRRRRRGRRGATSPTEPAAAVPGILGEPADDLADADEGDEEEATVEPATETEQAQAPVAEEAVLPPSPRLAELAFVPQPEAPAAPQPTAAADEAPPAVVTSEPADPGRSES